MGRKHFRHPHICLHFCHIENLQQQIYTEVCNQAPIFLLSSSSRPPLVLQNVLQFSAHFGRKHWVVLDFWYVHCEEKRGEDGSLRTPRCISSSRYTEVYKSDPWSMQWALTPAASSTSFHKADLSGSYWRHLRSQRTWSSQLNQSRPEDNRSSVVCRLGHHPHQTVKEPWMPSLRFWNRGGEDKILKLLKIIQELNDCFMIYSTLDFVIYDVKDVKWWVKNQWQPCDLLVAMIFLDSH